MPAVFRHGWRMMTRLDAGRAGCPRSQWRFGAQDGPDSLWAGTMPGSSCAHGWRMNKMVFLLLAPFLCRGGLYNGLMRHRIGLVLAFLLGVGVVLTTWAVVSPAVSPGSGPHSTPVPRTNPAPAVVPGPSPEPAPQPASPTGQARV
jgi:hypothetical protein